MQTTRKKFKFYFRIVKRILGKVTAGMILTGSLLFGTPKINNSKSDSDLRGDPQINVRKPGSFKEAEIMERVQEQGLVGNYRRPKMYLGDSDVDFVSLDGSKRYEVKSVVNIEHKSCQESAKDIVKNIQKLSANRMKSGETMPDYIFINFKDVPNSLRSSIAQYFRDQLGSISNLNRLAFVY